MSFTGRVPTIRVNLSMDARSSHSETWIVFDFGHTVPPTPNFCKASSCIGVEHVEWQT